MEFFLQIWGGGFYLLNKIFFALAEGGNERLKRQLRVVGWILYLLGVPAWVIILSNKHDWIAAAIEAGGIPAMLLGLTNAWRDRKPPAMVDFSVTICTYIALVAGLSYSLYDYGGLTSVSQLLEIGVMVGFLVGSYMLAKKNVYGWLFFLLMNLSMAILMFIQNHPLLTIQQLVSLTFVLYGFIIATRKVSP